MCNKLVGVFRSGGMQTIPLLSERVQNAMSELTVGWLLLQAAVIANEKIKTVSETHPDRAFYLGKIYAARLRAHVRGDNSLRR
ncbi:MAG: acyl-CoA dehydrogenase C-terminal domain-containing protein [Polyangiales bacterium]